MAAPSVTNSTTVGLKWIFVVFLWAFCIVFGTIYLILLLVRAFFTVSGLFFYAMFTGQDLSSRVRITIEAPTAFYFRLYKQAYWAFFGNSENSGPLEIRVGQLFLEILWAAILLHLVCILWFPNWMFSQLKRYSSIIVSPAESVQNSPKTPTSTTADANHSTNAKSPATVDAELESEKTGLEQKLAPNTSPATDDHVGKIMPLSPEAELRRKTHSVETEMATVSLQVAELEKQRAELQKSFAGQIFDVRDNAQALEATLKMMTVRGQAIDSHETNRLKGYIAKVAGLEVERDSILAETSKQIDVLKKRQAELERQLDELKNPDTEKGTGAILFGTMLVKGRRTLTEF